MQVSPSGMAAASQAVPGEFDSRHLLQKKWQASIRSLSFFIQGEGLVFNRGGAVYLL